MSKVVKSSIVLTVWSALLVNLFFISFGSASATTFSEGLKKTGGDLGYITGAEATTLPQKIGKVLNISTTFLGVVFLGLMIYAGFLWMLAWGNEQEVEKAKNIIIAAVIGLVVVLTAYAITQLMATLWGKTNA